ncbi:class I adenylate-forming enzyme family protein [Streptomyces spiramenti]|uniref:class I adenylate-forming enzyme family protein n=1 Tax=Streptomyces spiramenti TaxID=2720606 RepID=UPI001FD76FB3|nr:class I adenylate-forming enzyme family protein [Streptomyces spiramenti]
MSRQPWQELWSLPDHARGPVWAQASRPGTEVDAATLQEHRDRLARTFRCYGIRPGSTVALHGVPSYTQLWSLFALWSLNAQVVLLEPRSARAEREALLELCAPQFVVTIGELYEREDLFVGECEVLVRRRRPGRPARTAHCLVQFSSGTTGRPKAAGRTAQSLLTELGRLRLLPQMPREGERVAVLGPLAHSFALVAGVLHALGAGATVVFPATQAPQDLVEAARRSHVVIGGPRHFAALARAEEGTRLPDLRLAVSGGDVLDTAVAGAFARRYGVLVGQGYGMTETGIVSTDLSGAAGPGSIGTPVPGVRTRILGGVLGVRLAEPPYVHHGGPHDGWLATQDLVTRDPATGVLYLRGRVDSCEPGAVDALRIEAVLRAHRDVTDAVVLGADPPQALVACAQGLTRTELDAWCRRFLDPARALPCLHLVPELPRTVSGKVLRDRAWLHDHGWFTRPAPRRPGDDKRNESDHGRRRYVRT